MDASSDADGAVEGGSWSAGDNPSGTMVAVKAEPGASVGEDASARDVEQLCRVQCLLFTSLQA